MSYQVETNFIPGLPTIPYDSGHYVGVVAHATAMYNDTPLGERNYELTHYKDAFVHFFVGSGRIVNIADVNYIAYGAGPMANHLGYVHVELCQTYDSTQFAQDYAMYTWLLAKILFDRKLGVVDGVTLMSHAQVSAKWRQSTHEDPLEYLGSHGKSWGDVVSDVTRLYKQMEGSDVLDVAVLLFTKDDFWAGYDVAATNGNCAIFVRGAGNTIPKEAMSAKKLFVIGGGHTGHPNEVWLSGNSKYDTAFAVGKYLG